MNSIPIKLIRPEILRYKIYETVLIVGDEHFRDLNIRCRVSGGGQTSQIFALRQAIAKALVAYYAKYKDAASAFELKKLYTEYDRSLLIADPRRTEPKKFGGRGARARRQKSWVPCLGSRSRSCSNPLSPKVTDKGVQAIWLVAFRVFFTRWTGKQFRASNVTSCVNLFASCSFLSPIYVCMRRLC